MYGQQGDLAQALALMQNYAAYLYEVGPEQADHYAQQLEQIRQRVLNVQD